MGVDKKLREKIYGGQRISQDDAAALFSWDLIELGSAADFRRRSVFPDENVGFVIDRIINFTNICEAECRFCAYHARAGLVEPYELNIDEINRRVQELVDIGGTQVMLQGGLHPEYGIDKYLGLVSGVRKKFPGIYIHSLSPAEIVHISKKCAIPVFDVIQQLKAAGLNSVPGASDILVDRVRGNVCPSKITRSEWVGVMHALCENSMGSSATMTYGLGETLSERIEHLDTIRQVQDETGIIRAFIPWSFSPKNTGLADIEPATGVDYLKIIAVSRIFLDNIINFQAGWLTEGLKLAQVALSMGANDMGGVLMEEVVVKSTGIETSTNATEIVDIIRNAGKVPFLRDSEYKTLKLY